MTRGGRICFFSSLRNNRLAACLSLRRWTRTSRTIPVWSTARHNQCFTPAILSMRRVARGSCIPAQERTVQGRPVCARPSLYAEILGHRLLVATASPRYLGNRERVFWPKRLEHAVIVTPCRACANALQVSERPPTL